MTPRELVIYDTTLRDGSQSEGVAFSLEDKLEVAERLDDLGVHYIEGGWPGSNPKDFDFFREQRKLKLRRAKIAAFGSTRRAKLKVEEDESVRMLADCRVPVITVFGKSWDLHVTDALRTTLEENLRMIRETVSFLVGECDEFIYDAEHFFDGYLNNREYAIETLRAAAGAGAKVLVLCDTNGGRLPAEVARAVDEVRGEFPGLTLGIHAHNDSDLAAANTVAAVERGCAHVQGTVNGLGERCGNADLCTVIPTLQTKMGLRCLADEDLQKLTEVSRFIYETAVLQFRDGQPYVGRSAFAHKGGVHVSAVRRNPLTYEHVMPEAVGNERRVLVSELSGRSTLLAKSSYDLSKHPEKMKEILGRIQELENYGYQFEAAEASFELLVRKAMGDYRPFFELRGFRVISEKREDGEEITEATIKLAVDGEEEHTASEGNGPVNALDGALRKALLRFYPVLKEVSLVNFKVRIVDAKAATAARVRVTIESRDGTDRWTTVGVSENVIEASWIALVDSIEYKLFKDTSG